MKMSASLVWNTFKQKIHAFVTGVQVGITAGYICELNVAVVRLVELLNNPTLANIVEGILTGVIGSRKQGFKRSTFDNMLEDYRDTIENTYFDSPNITFAGGILGFSVLITSIVAVIVIFIQTPS